MISLKKSPRWLAMGLFALAGVESVQAAVCEYSFDNVWSNGFVAYISITNDSNEDITEWEVSWQYSGDNRVSSAWNTSLSGNNPYTANNLSWNGFIAPNQTVSFGIQGSKGGADPEMPTLMGDICTPTIPNEAPVADIQATPLTGDSPLAVTLSAADSFDPDGDFADLSFDWDFGDGATATGVDVTHTYDTAGDYTVTLTVSDGMDNGTATQTIEVTGNIAPIAVATANVTNGPAPLQVAFSGNASSDPDAGPDSLSYLWDFDDGSTSSQVNPNHTFMDNGVYNVTLQVSDGDATDTAELTIVVADEIVQVDNPFRGVSFYVDPIWSAKAAGEPGGNAIADVSTAVWMDRIGAITAGIGLRGHLDEALAQNAGLFMFVVYNLPNRDCAALASNGELRISENGFERYKTEYIDVIVDILADPIYASLRKVAIVEVDSLPNLVTNLGEPDCAEADGEGGYRDGITYALNALSTVPNVYSYVDVAHSGWLGWPDNFTGAVSLIGDVIAGTDQGWDSIAGFISNSANYTATVEPFLPDSNLNIGGMPIRSADFYEWNDYIDEKSFVQDWREAMIARGAPTTLGMLIDTSRNGWGGPDRPTELSQSDNPNTFVNESRVDRRVHRGNWCNQAGGVGFKPWADPYPGIDAFVWVKPPGESDGVADPNFIVDPDDPNKQHDPMCDPNAANRYNNAVGTGSMENAPHAGRWFPEQFATLLDKAYPDANEPAGPPPPPPPPRDNCPGLNQNNPVVISQAGISTEIDLGCEAPIYVHFENGISSNLYVENTGTPFNVNVTINGNQQNVSGYFSAFGGNGATDIIIERVSDALSVELRID